MQIDRCRYDGKNSCNQEGITKFDEHSDIRILIDLIEQYEFTNEDASEVINI
jgi:hypothetical protein